MREIPRKLRQLQVDPPLTDRHPSALLSRRCPAGSRHCIYVRRSADSANEGGHGTMTGRRRIAPAVLLMLALLAVGVPAATVEAATPADPSDVVLVFDFSASILTDNATRGRFATA